MNITESEFQLGGVDEKEKLNTKMRTGKVGTFQKIYSIAYALKDAAAITIAGFPIRANEIAMTVGVFASASKKKKSISSREMCLILVLLLNLAFTLVFGLLNWSRVDTGFLIKYLARNFLYVLVLSFFAIGKTQYGESEIAYLCKAIVLINVLFGIVLYVFGFRMALGEFIDTRTGSYSMMDIFGIRIPRYFGTASEAGYLGPFLMMPLYYFFASFIKERKYGNYLVLTFVIILLTFSPIVYAMTGLTCLYALKTIGQSKTWIRTLFIFGIIIVTAIVLYYSIPAFANFIDHTFLNKIKTILGIEGYWDFSGSDRTMHYDNCISQIKDQSFMQRLFGIGTGGYSFSVQDNSDMLLTANEAYNIYLSTLLDRGLVGTAVLFAVGVIISKFHIKGNVISNSIYIGIISQYIHWMITGNMWLCYFWIEVMYLIGVYRKHSGG